jgi:CHAT domain-containing protein
VRERLAAALGGRRFCQARLVEVPAYAPWNPPQTSGWSPSPRMRCTPPPPVAGDRGAAGLVAFVRRMSAAAAARPDRESLVAGGLGMLAVAESPRTVVRGVARIEQAAGVWPRDAGVLSDLAGAYLVRACWLERPVDLVLALERAHVAVGLNGLLPEARFNLALALEGLGLRGAAAGAWREYLRLDGSSHSGWVQEAMAHLQAGAGAAGAPVRTRFDRTVLERAAAAGDEAALAALVRRNPQDARATVEEDLLPRWARLALSETPLAADAELAVAARVARALAEATGDTLLAVTVEACPRRAAANGGDAKIKIQAAGFTAFARGMDAYRRNQLDSSRASLEAADRLLGAGGSPFRPMAKVQIAILDYLGKDAVGAVARLQRIRRDGANAHFHGLLGRAHWVAGLCHAVLGHPIDQLLAYRQAASELAVAGDAEGLAAARSLVAGALELVGEDAEAWRFRLAALGGAAGASARRRNTILGAAAGAALRMGAPAAALDFQTEAVGAARASGNPLDLAEALRARAEAFLERGDETAALADLRLAKGCGERLDGSLRRSVAARLREVEGRLLRRRDPRQAVVVLRQAVALLQADSFRSQLPTAYLELSGAELAAGDAAGAERALRRSVAIQEEELERAEGGTSRRQAGDVWVHYFDRRRDVFDSLIAILVARGEGEAALAAAERANEWEFALQRLAMPVAPAAAAAGAGRAGRLSPRQVASRIADGTAIVEYRALADRLIAWVVHRGQVRMHEIGVGSGALSSLASQLAQAQAGSGSPSVAMASAALRSLHGCLIAPLTADLDGAHDLVIVPDRDLDGIPFAALRDEQGHFLVERYAVGAAPGAGIYLRALARDRALARGHRLSALVAWGPNFDRALFPQLGSLAGSDEEGERIASLFAEREILHGGGLTRTSFCEGLGRNEIVHFSGHAVSSAANPLAAALPLTPDAGRADSGVLYAGELLGLRLPRTRLVVLASCGAMNGAHARTGKVEGLVRPFLGAGVPAVVAGLWPVDDRQSAPFFEDFHRRILAGESALHALAGAQRTQLHAPAAASGQLPVWAAFELFGASSSW